MVNKTIHDTVSTSTYLVSNEWFFYGGEIFQRRQQYVTMFRSTNVLDKISQFLAQCSENLVFIFHRL